MQRKKKRKECKGVEKAGTRKFSERLSQPKYITYAETKLPN